MNIYKSPRILIIHLKRFKLGKNIWNSKIEHEVKFDFELDMENIVQSKSLPSKHLDDPDSNMMYDLIGAVNQYGNLGGGHYTAFCKNENNNWYEFNDSLVNEIKNIKEI